MSSVRGFKQSVNRQAHNLYDDAISINDNFDWTLSIDEIKSKLKAMIDNFESAARVYGNNNRSQFEIQTFAKIAEVAELKIADTAFDLGANNTNNEIAIAFLKIAYEFYDIAVKYQNKLEQSFSIVWNLHKSCLYVLETLMEKDAKNSATHLTAIKDYIETHKLIALVKEQELIAAEEAKILNEYIHLANMEIDTSELDHKQELNSSITDAVSCVYNEVHDIYKNQLLNIIRNINQSTHIVIVANLTFQIAEIFASDDAIKFFIPSQNTSLLFYKSKEEIQKCFVRDLQIIASDLLNMQIQPNTQMLNEDELKALMRMNELIGARHLSFVIDKIYQVITTCFANNVGDAINFIGFSLQQKNAASHFISHARQY